MQLIVHGAGQTVTGSLYLVKSKTASFLMDCGLFQGQVEDRDMLNRTFGFDPKDIDFVILTHAHLDHCGRLPLLVRAGFRGPIYVTAATKELCTLLLKDVARTEEEDAAETRYRAQTSTNRRSSLDIEPLFTEGDADRAIRLLKTVRYNKKEPVQGDTILCFRDAGHILGSSIIETWVEENGRIAHIVNTGDIGRRNTPIIRDPDFPEAATYLLCESTYADRNHGPIAKSVRRFERLIVKAHRHRSHILVPAFSIGRTQTLIYTLNELVENARVPIIPVSIDSPLAIKATEIFKRHRECFDSEMWDLIEAGDAPLDFKGLQYVEGHNESHFLSKGPGPMIIIAGSGMMNGGRILRHLYHRIEDPKTTILVPGFQAPGTLGHRINSGARYVHIYGRRKRVRSRVERLYGFSAHADRAELQSHLRQLRREPPEMIFCVHGSPKTCKTLTKLVRKEMRGLAVAPTIGQEFRLT